MFTSREIKSEIRNEFSVTHDATEMWLIGCNKALKIPDKSEGNEGKDTITFLLAD